MCELDTCNKIGLSVMAACLVLMVLLLVATIVLFFIYGPIGR